MPVLFIYGIAVWFLFMILAIINGFVREKLYKPKTGDLLSHQISSIIFIAVIFLATYVFFAWSSLSPSSTELALLGLMWLIMTLVFEFGFGHFVRRQPIAVLLADYNILKGRIWTFVLIALAIAPWVVGQRV
jgi:hypothetical protein